MILKICIDGECINYQIPNNYRGYAMQILELIKRGNYTKAGLHIYSLLKKSRRV